MKKIKFKMFGRRSFSTVLFWMTTFCSLVVIINAFLVVPELVQNKNIPIIPNISPLLSQLAFLIPLVFIFYTFQKITIFTVRSIVFLYVLAICNVFALLFNYYTKISILNFQKEESLLLNLPTILVIIIALFLASLFNQGFQVQRENDLTI
jgi:hypothetical protein